jgi:acetyl-CoA carboxylase carboxyltransferase component
MVSPALSAADPTALVTPSKTSATPLFDCRDWVRLARVARGLLALDGRDRVGLVEPRPERDPLLAVRLGELLPPCGRLPLRRAGRDDRALLVLVGAMVPTSLGIAAPAVGIPRLPGHSSLNQPAGHFEPSLALGNGVTIPAVRGTDETGGRPEREDLAEVLERRALTEDAARPEAVKRRHAAGGRTARENIEELVDPGSFVEYGRFAIAAQRIRRDVQELIERTPADGLVAGTARVNGDLFGERSACAVLSYDYTVLAGTQGALGHRKKDRLFELIERMRLPTVFFAEGGGGRPGDTDFPVVSALDVRAFALWARLSGAVPRIAVVKGRCFAGNAVIAGCSDLIVATEDVSIGMGGPAMIAGGGLGEVAPDDVGPVDMQSRNGVIDVVVEDEEEAVAATKRLLGYFQGATPPGPAHDQTRLRDLVPERQRRAYDVKPIIETVADEGSVIFLREGFAPELITALARIEGRPTGVIANNTVHMAGAITSDGADKAARFMQLCDAFGFPLVSLVDTPGMMVGPKAEATGLVRHTSRLLVAGAALRVPFVAVILRRGYGLGAQAMVAGSLHEPLLTVAWPTAHLGPMGLEGAVRLAMRKELEAIGDEQEREQRVREVTATAQENAKALNAAMLFELDDVIDPAETRSLIASTFAAAGPSVPSAPRRFVDTW